MAKQIKVQSQIRAPFGQLRITATVTGINGWAKSVRDFATSGNIAEALDLMKQRIRSVMLDRFRKTKGESRWTKYTQTGATENILSQLGHITSNRQVGFYSLSFFDNDLLEEYMKMQEEGWDNVFFVYDKQNDSYVPAEDPIQLRPLTRTHSSGLGPGGRKFLLAAFEYWESIGRRQFEKDRLEIFRKFRKENGLN